MTSPRALPAAPGRSPELDLGPRRALRGHIHHRNFANYRLRLLLHCGVDWQTPVTTALRGRLHASW